MRYRKGICRDGSSFERIESRKKLVSLIILNYNGKKDTIEFLRSLKKTDYPNYEIIVVDNGSTDGSPQVIKRKFPYVKLIENKKNLGFAGGMNSGIKKSRGEYIVTLDNDRFIIQKEWLSLLVETAEYDKKIGVVIPMLLRYGTNKIQGWQVAPNFLTKITSVTFLFGAGKKDRGQFSKIVDIAAGNGLFKKEVLEKVGLFDEKMFNYFEETDLCYRIKKAGYRVVLQPKSKMWHKGSSTIKPKSYFAIYHSYKNKIRFILKNYDFLTKFFALLFNLGIYYEFLILWYALRGRSNLSKAVFDGIMWNIKNWKDYM
jgi:GT2 family glycosyltransferase